MSATATSDWPTPTVSTMTMSNPAASASAMVSRVLRVTPPSVPDVGEGRMKAPGSCARRLMRVLSPRMEPPVRRDVGSTASTARRVAGGDEVHAELVDRRRLADARHARDAEPQGAPRDGSSACSTSCASAACSGLLLSMSVMARASIALSPARTPET